MYSWILHPSSPNRRGTLLLRCQRARIQFERAAIRRGVLAGDAETQGVSAGREIDRSDGKAAGRQYQRRVQINWLAKRLAIDQQLDRL